MSSLFQRTSLNHGQLPKNNGHDNGNVKNTCNDSLVSNPPGPAIHWLTEGRFGSDKEKRNPERCTEARQPSAELMYLRCLLFRMALEMFCCVHQGDQLDSTTSLPRHRHTPSNIWCWHSRAGGRPPLTKTQCFWGGRETWLVFFLHKIHLVRVPNLSRKTFIRL